jgi:hypothetical protein
LLYLDSEGSGELVDVGDGTVSLRVYTRRWIGNR